MISHMEAFQYRCFEQFDIDVGRYHVLVGAHGSGKSTLLDIPLFLGDMVSRGVMPALLEAPAPHARARAQSLQELIYCQRGASFAFALEAVLPDHIVRTLVERRPDSVRSDQKRWPHRLRYAVRFQIVNKVELQVTDGFLL